MRKFGLIGNVLKHSLSKEYFDKKFKAQELVDYEYELYELSQIKELNKLLKNEPELCGFNITIPYKKEVLPFLYEIDQEAIDIWAVNTVKISRFKGKPILKGYNTDAYGFKKALIPHLHSPIQKALILGTGGAAAAAKYVLHKMGIETNQVSRSAKFEFLDYTDVNEDIIKDHKLIINCTPLGMFPNTNDCPKIPYQSLSSQHILFDMVYNPLETKFLKKGRIQGALCIDGLEMLHAQAEKAWEIWTQ